MRISILGSKGIVGNAIFKSLKNKFIYELNSNSYEYTKNIYKLNKFKPCDYFIHAAGVTEEEINAYGVRSAKIRSSHSLKKLLLNLINKGCKNFVYISSMRIYKENVQTIDEKKTLIDLNSSYKICHFLAEKEFKVLALNHKVNCLILRPGAVYGFPAKRKKNNRMSLIPYSFPYALFKNKKIILKTSGDQFRNFISNNDIAIRVKKWVNMKKKKLIISNVKGDKTMTVKDFAKLCIKIYENKTNFKTKLEYKKSKVKFKRIKIHQNLNIKNKDKINFFLNKFFNHLKYFKN